MDTMHYLFLEGCSVLINYWKFLSLSQSVSLCSL
uniref:Uncharacterized protein n=1 Tax=Anguilla anguilla TaxID=7936 RepID=A0A0E9RB05_ANGAN